MIKTILFDFDGTIIDTKSMITDIYNKFAEKYNYKILSDKEMDEFFEIPILDRCKKVGIPAYKIPMLLNEAKHIYDEHIASVDLINGIDDVILSLKQKGFNMGIISSNSEDTIRQALNRNGIHAFDNIYSSKNLFGKHRTINAYLKQFKINKEEVLYIGDEVRDIVSCKKSGIKVIAVTWGYDSTKLLMKETPDYLAYRPEDIIEIINKF